MKGKRIPGEYKRVSILTNFPYIMEESHREKIDLFEAVDLVEKLSEVFPVIKVKVKFSERDKRGHAGFDWNGKDGYTQATITLPGESGAVRTGLVLHEFAHVLKGSQGLEGKAHGLGFIRAQDEVLKWWFLERKA